MGIKARHHFLQYDIFRLSVDRALNTYLLPINVDTRSFSAVQAAIRTWLATESQNVEVVNSCVADIADKLGEIAKEALFAHLLINAPLEPYFSVAHVLRDVLLQEEEVPDINPTDLRWIQAIICALCFSDWSKLQGHSNRIEARDITLARSVRYFTDRNVEVIMNGVSASINSRSQAAAATACIMIPMLSLGDKLAMQLMSRVLEQRFSSPISRLRLHPNPDSMGQKMERNLPCGLLYRFAIKTIGRKKSVVIKKSISEDIFKAATAFAALYDVEPFSIYENMFPPKSGKILEVLGKITAYDELFTIPQCDPVVIYRFLEIIFSRVPAPEATAALHWSIEDARNFWSVLLGFSNHPFECAFVKKKDFKAALASRVGWHTCESLLRSFVIDNPNSQYQFPVDAHRADTRECVIAAASGERYWLPGRLMMGPAFYERLFSTRVAHSSAMSADVGREFEHYLVERMNELGISFRRGNIRGKTKSGIAGDVDLVIETNEIIGLFELKKKGLRRETQAGNAFHLAIDLAQGLVHGVNQLSRHENTLLKDGKLQFEDGVEIYLNERRIVKGVISLADYGGLHDSTVVRNILSAFSGASINSLIKLTKDQEAALDDANKKFRILGERRLDFEKIRTDDMCRSLFDNVVFHNIFFIEFLLTTANTAEAFLKGMLTISRLTTGSRDPFFEYAQFVSLQMESVG